MKLNQDYDKIRECTDTKAKTFKTPLFLTKGKSYYIHCLKDTTWNVPAYADTTSFTYDGDGGRLTKTSNNDITTYIGSLYETKLDGTTTKHIYCGSTRIASITLSPGGEGQGEGEKVSYYLSDHLGSSSVITDSSGKVTREYEYKPFGEIFTERIYDPNSETPNFFFTGKRLDRETGLYYYGARYYDPALGKFITPDTIVQAPFDPQSLNRYSYCRNNPINLIDPTGHSWKQWKGKVIGAIVGIVVLVVTYNPQLAMMAYSFVSTAIDAHTAGYSTGRAIGMAAASAAASYIGGRIGVSFGEALGGGAGTSGGMFWGSVFGGMGSGAAGGAAGAAVAGGDVGKAAYQGAAIGAAMGVVSYVLSGGGAQQQQQDQTQEEIDLAAKNGDFQQANDIGAESGPEGRMAAAEDVARVALTGGAEGSEAARNGLETVNRFGDIYRRTNFDKSFAKFYQSRALQIPAGHTGYFDLIVNRYSGIIVHSYPHNTSGYIIYKQSPYVIMPKIPVEGVKPSVALDGSIITT